LALHIQCSTPRAVLLIAVEGPRGLFRFPNDRGDWPGLGLQVDMLNSINEQLQRRAQEFFGPWGSRCHIWQEYSALLDRDGSAPATLYVAKITPKDNELDERTWAQWLTLPELVQTLPKDRNRLSYLKAWQILSGALEENTKALDVDEVARYLRSLKKSPDAKS